MSNLKNRDNWFIRQDGVGYGIVPAVLQNALVRLTEVSRGLERDHHKDSLANAVHRINLVIDWATANIPADKATTVSDGYKRRAPAISDG